MDGYGGWQYVVGHMVITDNEIDPFLFCVSDFIDSFEEVIICMDNDEAGRKAVQEAIKVLPENKVKVMVTSLKDCSEMLQTGKQKQFISDFYSAKPLIETGIISASEASDEPSLIRIIS